MANQYHTTLAPVSSLVRAPGIYANQDELLKSYSSWLFLERHFLNIARFGAEKARDLFDVVSVDNDGARFHLPAGIDLPDYGASVRRAATVLSAAGLEISRLARH
jgi:hypothetical protein